MTLEPVEVQDPEVIREIVFGLRVEAWRSVGVLLDGTFPADVCEDDHEDHSLHWVIRGGDRIVAAARMCVHDSIAALPDAEFFVGLELDAAPPLAALNRLVVDPEYQHRGFSYALDQIRIRKAAELGCRSVWGVAPPIRWGPLQRQGFQVVAPVNPTSSPRWLRIIQAARAPELPEIRRKIMMLPL